MNHQPGSPPPKVIAIRNSRIHVPMGAGSIHSSDVAPTQPVAADASGCEGDCTCLAGAKNVADTQGQTPKCRSSNVSRDNPSIDESGESDECSVDYNMNAVQNQDTGSDDGCRVSLVRPKDDDVQEHELEDQQKPDNPNSVGTWGQSTRQEEPWLAQHAGRPDFIQGNNHGNEELRYHHPIRDVLVRILPSLDNAISGITRDSLSSDYWKGLLVGLYVCQSLFVPLWAASTTGSNLFQSGLLGFFQVSLWKIFVFVVSGVGFVMIAVIGVQYDRTLKAELNDIRQIPAVATIPATPKGTQVRATAIGEGAAPDSTCPSPSQQPPARLSTRSTHSSSPVPGPPPPPPEQVRDGRLRGRNMRAATAATSTDRDPSISVTASSTASRLEELDANSRNQGTKDRKHAPDFFPGTSKAPSNEEKACATALHQDVLEDQTGDVNNEDTPNNMKNQNNLLSIPSTSNRSITFPLSSHTEHSDKFGDSLWLPTQEITYSTSASYPTSMSSLPHSSAEFFPEATVMFVHISGMSFVI
jgi:hypothetical protein